MVKGGKKAEVVESGYTSIRVLIPKRTYKTLKIKCALRDITVKKAIIDLVDKWVKDTKRDLEGIMSNL